jgi:protein involved in polysaccharide export with SLBB domain
MNLKSSIFLYLLIILSFQIFPQQQLPDYPERFFQDSLSQVKSATLMATDGIINPDEYRVGPGDKLFISISGVKEISTYLLIDQEGWLYIPNVGGIELANSTLAQAKNKIIESILKYYKDVDIFVSLVDFRMIKISLIGNVLQPSVFVIPANSRLMDLMTQKKELKETSDIRNIKIISRNNEINSYDLLRFLRFGDLANNPFLLEGDAVLVDKIDKIIKISGDVVYPAIYEYRSDESVKDFIDLAGGFTFKARKDTIELVRFVENGKKQISEYFSYDQLEEKEIYLQNKDHVIVREIPEYLIDQYVVIEGYVNYPGWYKINKNQTTLKDLIELSGGFLPEASLRESSVDRKMDVEDTDPEYERLKTIPVENMTEDEYDYYKAKSRQHSGTVVVDFVKLFEDNDVKENIILRKNDLIKVPEKKNYVIMLGQLVNPGKVIYDSTLTVNDYIELAGGFGWRAQENDVRVIKAKSGEWVEADDVQQLRPGDTIWVPEEPPSPKFWVVFTDVLTILAQVAAIVAASAAVVVATR